MTTRHTKPGRRFNPAPRVTRFPGICAAARELGVTRNHLYQVLAGIHTSRRLTLAYINLLHKRAANPQQ